MWGLPFAVGFIVLRSFVAAFARTRAVLVAALVAARSQPARCRGLLIFGGIGLPPLGTRRRWESRVTITFALMFGLLLGYCLTAAPFRRYNVLGRFWRPDCRYFPARSCGSACRSAGRW